MTLRKKLISILSALAVCPMIFVGILGYFSAKTALEKLRMEQLKSITDLKAKKIEAFFAEHKNHLRIAQRRPTIKKYAAILYDFDADFTSPVYADIRDELDRALQMYPSVYDYANVMLANPQGKIVYALNRFSNLEDMDRYLPDLWQESFTRGKSGIYLSDVFRNQSQAGHFSVYITAPLHNFNGTFVGVIALEVDMASIFILLQDATGMGTTGETLIARQEGEAALFLNPLRHDQNAALQRRAMFGQPQAIPIQAALKGKAGSGISTDYRGEEVVAAWQGIPSLDWGIVAKIDSSEAFKAATTLRNFVFLLVIAVIVLSILLAFMVAKSISDPIRALQEGAAQIGRGNLDFKIGTAARDELGQLGRAFDQMTAELKIITASRDELDREVTERKKAEEDLQESMGELEERVKELHCLFEISRLVEKRGLAFDEILRGIVNLMPPAWQYPDITCARMDLNGKQFQTANFAESRWQLSSKIIVHAVPSGELTVCYLEERPPRDVGPFLIEERALLDAIAERVGRIIERKWAQDALHKSEEKFRELMENMVSGVAVCEAVADGEDFEVKDYNRSGERIDNIDRAKVIGRRVNDVFPWAKSSGLADVLQRVWKTGIPEHCSGVLYRDQHTRPSWRENYVYKLSSGAIVVVYQDVTEVKLARKALEESEKRFRDLVENALTGISIVQNKQVVYQNQEQERLLGPMPRSYLFGDYERIHPDDVERVRHLSRLLDKGEIQALEAEFRFHPRDLNQKSKEMKWIFCRTMPTRYRGNEAILFNMIDMTKAKELEHLLAIQDKMASLGRVAAGIAHEIRNPLSGINIYLNTLKKLHHKDGSEEKVEQILGQIQSASHKIESVIRRVMDFAKPSEPRLDLVDLNQPFKEAIDLCAVTLRKAGISLKSALDENLPLCYADASLIEEMVLNILNNAAEAMHTTGTDKKILVTSSVQDQKIVLTIADSGPGIAPEVKDKVFDPYFTTKTDGTGIGLSLCHRIAMDHGGFLTVADSELGGAEFRIEIPIKEPGDVKH